MQCMGFVNFDIRELGGAALASATLSFTLDKKWGKPEDVWPVLVLSELYWGPRPIEWSDSFQPARTIQNFSSANPSFSCSNDPLKTALQEAIDAGRTRFQLKINFWPAVRYSNFDWEWDGWSYRQKEIKLTVQYLPGP